jgi:hypothetical protein
LRAKRSNPAFGQSLNCFAEPVIGAHSRDTLARNDGIDSGTDPVFQRASHLPALNRHLTKSRLNDAPRLCEMLCRNFLQKHRAQVSVRMILLEIAVERGLKGTRWNLSGCKANEYQYQCVRKICVTPRATFFP